MKRTGQEDVLISLLLNCTIPHLLVRLLSVTNPAFRYAELRNIEAFDKAEAKPFHDIPNAYPE